MPKEPVTATIEFGSRDVALAFAFFGAGGTVTPGDRVEIPGGGTLTYLAHVEEPIREVPTILVVALALEDGVDTRAIAEWMMERARGKAISMAVDGVDVAVDGAAVERVLQERMRAPGGATGGRSGP